MFAISQSAEHKQAVRTRHRSASRSGCAVLAAIAMLGFAATAPAARFDFDSTPGRLPKDVVPAHYTLRFDLDPARDTFSGRADIDLTVRRPTSAIVLQATELDATQATLSDQSGASRDVVITPERDSGMWRIGWKSGEPIPPGRWRLSIDYRGKVETRGQGLFRVEYRTGVATRPAGCLQPNSSPLTRGLSFHHSTSRRSGRHSTSSSPRQPGSKLYPICRSSGSPSSQTEGARPRSPARRRCQPTSWPWPWGSLRP